jgi:hypothetical protein
MAKIRVWNITDDSTTTVEPHNRMVLGKVVKPGRSILVDADRLALAHKVHKEVKAGILHIGDVPPSAYAAQKAPPRATVDARIVNGAGQRVGAEIVVATGHGTLPTDAVVSDGLKAVEIKLDEQVVPEPTTTPDETTDDGSKSFRSKHRR